MSPIKNPYIRHRFSPEIISHAVWLYHRFTLSFRDIEELLAIRVIHTSTVNKDGSQDIEVRNF
jgi:transposase-like protein